jgi:hypothetical protein
MHLIPHIHHILASLEKCDHLLKVFAFSGFEALAIVQDKPSVFVGDNLLVNIRYASFVMLYVLRRVVFRRLVENICGVGSQLN